MKTISTKLFAVLVLFIVTATSCKKETGVDNTQQLLGTWTLTEFGDDLNKNNQVDAGEVAPAGAIGFSATMVFKSDKTFSFTYDYIIQSDTENGTYSLANNTLTTVANSETTHFLVNTLTSNKLIVKENGPDGEWLVFTK